MQTILLMHHLIRNLINHPEMERKYHTNLFSANLSRSVCSRVAGIFLLACSLWAGLSFSAGAQTTIGGVNMGNLTDYLFVFTDANAKANWQGATKGFVGDVAIDGIQANETTSGSVPYAGTIYTNDNTLGAWGNIVANNSGQAMSSLNQVSLISGLETDLANAFSQINALTATPGYTSVSATSLNGLNTQNSIAEVYVINVTSGFSVSSQINITGDADDVFILRWDTDADFGNGYQGQVKFQSGGAIVPLGGLEPSNFIHVAGDINSSGGGSTPAPPYPQGPRFNDGQGALINNGADFNGGGFFTGYWLTTGAPSDGKTSSLSNGIFVGGWYSSTTEFSMTSGTSGVYVSPSIVNSLPVANRDDYTINQNAPATPLPVLANDNFGADGPCVNCAITITTPPANGTAMVNVNSTPGNPVDDFIEYTPAPSFSGNDTLIYQICDFNNDCDTALVVITVVIPPCVVFPTVFSVTGGGDYCAGNIGVPVGLSGSQTGLSYQLKRNGTDTGAPTVGTGSAISFGNQLFAGSYTVEATIIATGCTAGMNGSVQVLVNPSPSISFTTTTPACDGDDGAIQLFVIGGSEPYTYNWADLPGDNNPADRTGLAPDIYAVTVTGSNGCATEQVIVLSPASGCPPIEICDDVTNDVYYIAPVPGVLSYFWTVPSGATIVSGQGTTSITVDWTGASYGSGSICVTPETSCSMGTPFCIDVVVANCTPIDLQLSKTVSPTSQNVGGTVTFTINLFNVSTVSATGVAVEDYVPAGFTVIPASISDGGSIDLMANTVSWSGLTVAPFGSKALTFQATVNAPTGAPDEYRNVAQVTDADQQDVDSTPGNMVNNTPNEDDEDDATMTLIVADLSLNKSVDNTTPKVGDVVAFTIALSNAGPNAASGVEVKDYVPAGYSNIAAISGLGSLSGSTITWSGLNVPVGMNTVTLNFQATVDAPTNTPGEYKNTAEVTASNQYDPDSQPNNMVNNTPAQDDEDDAEVFPQSADISLAKSVNVPAPNVGDVVTFTLTISNAGPNGAVVSLEDYLPNGYGSIANISNGGTESMGTITWTGLSVPASGSIQVAFEATVLAPGMGVSHTNTAQITASDQFDPNSTPNNMVNNTPDPNENDEAEVVVTPQQADLSLNKSVSDPAPKVGDVATFTITLSNAGPDDATGVAVADYLPNGYGSIANISNSGTISMGTITWMGLTVPASGSIMLTFDVTVLAPGMGVSYYNTAQVTAADQYDPNSQPNNMANNTPAQDDEDFAEVTPQSADISLAKSVNDPAPNVGDVVTFTLTISNAGPNDAVVSLEDYLPNGYGSIANISNGGSESMGTITWTGLSVPASGSIQVTFEATVLAPGTGISHTNTAQITASDQFDPNSQPNNMLNNTPVQDDEAEATVTPKQADLVLSKSVSPTDPNAGDVVTFTITLTNNGPDAATGVAVEDYIPQGFGNIANISGGGMLSGSTITWSGLTVMTMTPVVLTFEAEVNDPTGTFFEYRNVAQVTASDVHDPTSTPGNLVNNTPAEDDEDFADTAPQQADLTLEKTISNATPNVGDVVTFTITLSNNGPSDATGVAVEDYLPNGFGSVTNISDGGVFSLGTVSWSGLTVPASGTKAVTFQATVLAPGMGVSYTNVAQVTASDQFDPTSFPNNLMNNTPAEDDEDAVTAVPQQADLSLTKTADNSAPNVGADVVFTITVNNAGPDAATNVTVKDQLPAGLAYVSDNSGGDYNDVTGIWTVGAIPANSSASIQITATVLTAGAKTNYAQVQSVDQYDPNSTPGNDSTNEDDDDSVTVTPPSANLILSKNASNTSPNVGDVVTFTLQVANLGPNTATNVAVEDYLPNGYGNIAAISNGGMLSGSTITWSGLTIPFPGVLSLTFQAEVLAPLPGVSYLNVAQITASDQFDPTSTPGNLMNNTPAEDDEASRNLTPRQADLSLAKSVSPASGNVGDVVTFTLTLSNAGPNVATGVAVQDYVPAGFSNITAISGSGSESMGTITWSGLTVPVGMNTITLAFQATVDAPTGDPDEYRNTAQVTAGDVYDPDSQPNNMVNNTPAQDDEAEATFTLLKADLSMQKLISDPAPNVGDVVTFTINLSNAAGSVTATGVAVEDYLPAGFTYVPMSASNGGSFSMGTVSWSGLTVPVGMNTLSLSFQATVNAPTGASDEYKNVAQVTASDQYDPNSTPNNLVGNTPQEDDEATVTAMPQVANLSLNKAVDNPTANVGDQVTFTITLSNAGPDAATGVEVRDFVPSGYSSITDISGMGSESMGVVSWASLTVPVGMNTVTLSFKATVNAPTNTPNQYRNVAQVWASDQYDPNSTPGDLPVGAPPAQDDESAATVNPPIIDLELVKFANNTTPNVGQAATFTILVSNNVSAANTATGIVVRDLLPASLVYLPGSIAFNAGTTGATIIPDDSNPTALTWSINQLAPGQSVILTLQANVLAPTNMPGEYLNEAEVIAANEYDIDSTPGDGMGDDYDTDEIFPKLIDVELAMVVDIPNPNVGETVTFTLTLVNQGPDAATNIQVQDLIPAGYTYVPMSISNDPNMTGASINNLVVNSATLQWFIDQLDPGETVFLSFQAVVNTPTNTPDEFLNVAEVIAHTEYDIDSSPNDGMGDDYAELEVTIKAVDIELVKSVDISSPSIGQNVTFILQLSNNSNGGLITETATGVVVNDLLPSGFTYQIGTIGFNTLGSGATIVPDASSAPVLSWTVNNLDPGKTVILSFQAKVNAATLTPNQYLNVAEVVAMNEYDIDSTPGDGMGDDYDTELVMPVNDPPVANDDNYTTPEDTPLVITTPGVLVNDSDPNGDPILASLLTPPTNGMVMLNPDGSFTYTPDPDFYGIDIFTYEVCDPLGLCDDATVTITVTPVNDPPVAVDDFETTDQDTPVIIDVLANDSDVDGNLVPSSVTIITPPSNGMVSINPITGEITYTPDPGFFGVDDFVYQVCDDGFPLPALCDQATVTVTVIQVQADLVANNDTYGPVNGYTGDPNVGNALDNDTSNGDPVDINDVDITVLNAATPLFMGAPVPELNTTTGVVSVPAGTPAGVYYIDYQICEIAFPANCDDAVITVTVIAPEIVANDDTFGPTNGYDGDPNAGNVLDNDLLNGDPVNPSEVTIAIVDDPMDGVTLDPLTGIVSVDPGTPAGTYNDRIPALRGAEPGELR
jgi:uncharacterized repeat protein (TIGR01451 family)